MNPARLKRYLYSAFVICVILFCALLLAMELSNSDWHDFDVFYNSAKAALAGTTIYIVTGKYNLPFWYPPWAAWFYIPFAIWPMEFAKFLYKAITIISAILIVHSLTRYHNPGFKFQDKLLILALLIPMSLELMTVGQMDYILLGLIVMTMYAIEQKKDVVAGVLFPFLWIKPHLLIVFTLFGFWRAGKRTILISLALSALMLIIETIISPNWLIEMLNLLQQGGTQKAIGVSFTTLPNLLGSQENWIGTANLPFTTLLIILAVLLVWKFRFLPTLPLLSLALAASLFCAPRAHAYDLAMLIPAMIWLTAKEFKSTGWLWFVAAAIAFASGLTSPNAYIATLLVFAAALLKAYKISGTSNKLSLESNQPG